MGTTCIGVPQVGADHQSSVHYQGDLNQQFQKQIKHKSIQLVGLKQLQLQSEVFLFSFNHFLNLILKHLARR